MKAVFELMAEHVVRLFKPPVGEGIPCSEKRVPKRQGFFDEIVGAQFSGAYRGCDCRVAGNHNHARLGRFFAQLPECVESVHAGQPYIQEDEIVRGFLDLFQAVLAASYSIGREAFINEDALQRLPDTWLVIDNEDSWHTGNS